MPGRAVLVSLAVVLLARIDAFRGTNGQHQTGLMMEGPVGCLFSNLICSEKEECVDDGLFGNCQKTDFPKDTHRYRLDNDQLIELEELLQFLITSGYTWHSRFTQCILINSLIAYRYHFKLNLELCGPLAKPSREEKILMTKYLFPSEVRRKNEVRRNSKFGKRDQQRHIDSDRILEMDSFGGMKNHDDQKRWIPDDFGESRDGRHSTNQDVENFDEFFDNLSPDELQNLKQFVIEEENEDLNRDQPVKKSPAMVTNVVVHYIPGNSKGSDLSKEKEMKSDAKESKVESTDKDLATAEQMFPSDTASQKILEPSDKESDERTSPRVEFSGQQRTGFLRNPLPLHYLMTVSGPGSQLGLTTLIPAADAQGKDVSHPRYEPIEVPRVSTGGRTRQYLITMYFLCGVVGVIIAAALVIYMMRRHAHLKDKISKWAGTKGVDETTSEYQDLCRQHMQAKLTEKVEPVHKTSRVEAISSAEQAGRSTSTGSSTSSWTEEPVSSNMDISTGHIVLSYMEDHLTNKDRLQKEWDSLCAYDAEPCSIVAAIDPTNMRKNRYTDILPYEHSRVKLNPVCNVSGSDYINACTITDHDPRNPAYIAAQGPLPHTVADFWQMIWEQGSVVIVNLTRLTENTISVCHRYWPEEGSDLYHIYEMYTLSIEFWRD